MNAVQRSAVQPVLVVRTLGTRPRTLSCAWASVLAAGIGGVRLSSVVVGVLVGAQPAPAEVDVERIGVAGAAGPDGGQVGDHDLHVAGADIPAVPQAADARVSSVRQLNALTCDERTLCVRMHIGAGLQVAGCGGDRIFSLVVCICGVPCRL
jgi:hypothetical protein